MKGSFDRRRLHEVVSLAEKSSGKNLTLSVLNCVLIELKKGMCVVRSTNLDLGLEVLVPGDVEKEGVVAVPGGTLSGILSTVHASKVTLSADEGNLHIGDGKNTSLVKALPHDDFPTLPVVEGVTVSLPVDDLVHGIRSVWYASSVSSIKPELSSIYMYPDKGGLVFVATDSFRLAEKVVTGIGGADSLEQLLVPFRNAQDIMRVLDKLSGDVELTVSQNQASIRGDGVYVTSRLVDGSFPDYKQIIPKQFVTEVTMLREDLMNTLKKTAIFSDKFNQLTLEVNVSKNTLTLASENADIGNTKETLDVSASGENLTIKFNQKYLSDFFQSVTDDNITLSLSGVGKPMVIKPASDDSFTYLVMPMNR